MRRLGDLAGNTATYICEHVFANELPVAFVYWGHDDHFGMLCGRDHDWDKEGVHVVGVGHLLSRHPELKAIELAQGWEAEKGPLGYWKVSQMPPPEESREGRG